MGQDTSVETKEDGGAVPPGTTIETLDARAKGILEGKFGKLAKVEDLPGAVERMPEDVPSLKQQLEVIVAFGKLYDEAPREDEKMRAAREALWQRYIAAVDAFRLALGLPKIKEAGVSFTLRLMKALDNKDANDLWNIFVEESRVYERPKRFWDKVKRVRGINFLAGILGGAGELAHGVLVLANEGRKAAGMAVSREEQEAAKHVMGAVFEHFKHLDKLAIAITRKEEYLKSLNEDQGETTGYVLGKHYFDIALIILGIGTAKKAIAHGAHSANEGAAIAAETAGAMRIGAEIAERAVPRVLPKAGHATKHVLKEGATEMGKEGIKHTPNVTETTKKDEAKSGKADNKSVTRASTI